MTPPHTLFGRALSLRWLADPVKRRASAAGLTLLFAILTFYPRYYHASVQIIEPQVNAAGLSAVLGQLGGNYAALLSSGQTYEINLAVGRTFVVEREVIRRMKLEGTPRFGPMDDAVRKLRKLVTVRSMRGGIIGIEVADRNPQFALQLVTIYAQVYSDRLTEIARQQTQYKRRVLNQRMQEAAQRLATAQGALDRFRARYRLPSPESQLESSVGNLTGLKTALQTKLVELESASQFATPNNMRIRSLQAEIASLRQQIHDEQIRAGGVGDQTATGLAQLENQYDNLRRDVTFAQSLYQAYSRYIEGSAVEDLSAAWNLQQLEPAYIHPGHQINKLPAAIILLIVLAALAAEVYLIFPARSSRTQPALPA